MKPNLKFIPAKAALLGAAFGVLLSAAARAERPLGIDTSHWNGQNVDWTAVYNAGYRFAFTKSSESTWYADNTVATNMFKARAAGILIGPYHFGRPEDHPSTAAATNEADWFIACAGQYMTNGYLRPVLDLESGGELGKTTLSAWVNAFCNRIKQVKGVSPIIYTRGEYCQNYLNSSVTNWDLWIAQWPYTPDPQGGQPVGTGIWNGRWVFWQYVGDIAGIPGVPSTTDLDVFNGTLAELQGQLIGGGTNPPAIAIQPANTSTTTNGSASFTVVAYGGAPLYYQWQKNNANLSNTGHYSGVTTATLLVSNADGNDIAAYRCVITNAYGSVTSSPASLTLVASCEPNPLVNGSFEGGNTGGVATGWTAYQRAPNPGTSWSIETASPPPGAGAQYQQIANTSSTGGGGVRQDVTGCVIGATYAVHGWFRGNSGYSTCRVRVSPTASADWSTAIDLDPPQSVTGSTWTAFSGTVVATATTMTLWLDGQTGGSGLNKAECFDAVSVTCGSLPPQPPTILQQPAPATNCPGTTATFSVVATGSGTLSYQWQTNQTDLGNDGHFSGTTTPTLTINGVTANDAASYQCRVSNTGGWTSSVPASLSVRAATLITHQPASAILIPGGTHQFAVAATGDGTLTYRWQKDGAALNNGGHYSGCTTPTLTITGADTSDVASYRCVVTGGCGDAVSDPAILSTGCGTPALTNGNFEGCTNSGVACGWTSYEVNAPSVKIWSIETASAPEGGHYQQIQAYNAAHTASAGVRQDITGCTVGATYRVSGWYRSNSDNGRARVRVSPSASTNWNTAVDLNPVADYGQGEIWSTFSGTVVATGPTMTLWLDGRTIAGTSAKVGCFDAVTVTCESAPATLRITAAALLPPQHLRLTVSGAPGANVTLLRSTNLLDWTPWTNAVNTNGILEFTDVTTTNAGQRFYRARSP